MTSKIYFVLLSLLIACSANASNDLYIKLLKNNEEVELGYYSTKKMKRVVVERIRLDTIDYSSLTDKLPLDQEKKTLVFIHGMWGHKKGSQRSNLKLFNKLCEDEYQIISIIWRAGHLKYKKNWDKSIGKGKLLAPVLDAILPSKTRGHSLLCHSMGSRILEGFVEASDLEFKFENILFMASDSHASIFNEKLKPLLSTTQRINVYFHQKDKALKTSTRIQKRDRLGLYGAKLIDEEVYSEIKFIDVTRTKAKGSRGFTRHVYFKKDRKVKADMKRIFLDQEEERALELIKAIDNLYKL